MNGVYIIERFYPYEGHEVIAVLTCKTGTLARAKREAETATGGTEIHVSHWPTDGTPGKFIGAWWAGGHGAAD